MKISIYIALGVLVAVAIGTWYVSKNYHISNIAANTATSPAAVANAASAPATK